MLDHGEEHAELFQRELLGRGLVEDVTAIGAEVESLVSDLTLKTVWQVQEHLDQVAVDDLGEIIEVNLSLDMALAEGFMVAPWVSMTVTVASNRQASRQVEVPLVFAHLLLKSVEEFGNWFNQENAGQKVTLLSSQAKGAIQACIQHFLLLNEILELLRAIEE